MAGVPVPDDMIVITKAEYDLLKADSAWLAALEAAGVDNWEGYEYAQRFHGTGVEPW
jgi:phage pi2 protein 07